MFSSLFLCFRCHGKGQSCVAGISLDVAFVKTGVDMVAATRYMNCDISKYVIGLI